MFILFFYSHILLICPNYNLKDIFMLPMRDSAEFPAAMKAARETVGLSRSRLSALAGYNKDHTARFEEPTFSNFRIPSSAVWASINIVLENAMSELKKETTVNLIDIAANDSTLIQTFWQPVLPYGLKEKPLPKVIEYFTVEGISSEVLRHPRFKDFNWLNTDWPLRVCVKFNDLASAQRLYGLLQLAGLVALRDWVE